MGSSGGRQYLRRGVNLSMIGIFQVVFAQDLLTALYISRHQPSQFPSQHRDHVIIEYVTSPT